jgi:hypothetical protein
VRVLVCLLACGCSFTEGRPASHGWPSGDPDNYTYTFDPPCRIYAAAARVDTLGTLAASAVAILGFALRSDDIPGGSMLAIVGTGAGIPLLASTVAGMVGQSRCERWSQEVLYPQPGDQMATRAVRADRRE